MCKGGTEGCERLLSHSLVACVCNSHTSYFRIICYNILYRVFHKSGTVVSQVKINECKFRGLVIIPLVTGPLTDRSPVPKKQWWFHLCSSGIISIILCSTSVWVVTHFEITNILVIKTFFITTVATQLISRSVPSFGSATCFSY